MRSSVPALHGSVNESRGANSKITRRDFGRCGGGMLVDDRPQIVACANEFGTLQNAESGWNRHHDVVVPIINLRYFKINAAGIRSPFAGDGMSRRQMPPPRVCTITFKQNRSIPAPISPSVK